MKNLQTIKRIAVTLMTVAMIFTSLSLSAFAAVGDPGYVAVQNVEKDAIVKIYQFVKMETIDGQGEWVKMIKEDATAPKGYVVKKTGFAAADMLAKDSDENGLVPKELVALAAKAAVNGDLDDGITLADYAEDPAKPGFGTYSGTVDAAGMYVVIVQHGTGSKVYVYNPMALGVKYNGQKIGTASVDAAGDLRVDNNGNLDPTGEIVIAKRVEVPFDKQVTRIDSETGLNDDTATADVDESKETEDTLEDTNKENPQTTNDGESKNYRGDTAGKGDVVHYTITSAIPNYADNYKAESLVFNVYDELSKGLLFNNDVEVFVGGEKIDATASGKTNWELVQHDKADLPLDPDDDNYQNSTFMVKFASDFLKDHFNEAVVVKYSATVADDCEENFDPETNTARLRYTNGPREVKDEEPITTYHYTFTINGKTQKKDGFQNRELVKVGVDNTGAHVFGEKNGQVEESGWQPLQGATFELFKADQMKDDLSAPKDNEVAIREAKSAADGRLMSMNDETVPGLDRLDAGIYYLVEKTVPSPYKVNATPVRIVILAELYQNDEGNAKAGMLKSYKIIVAGADENGDYPADLEAGIVGGSYVWDHVNNTATRPVGNTTFFVEKTVAQVKALTDDDKAALKITNVEVAQKDSNGDWGDYAAFDEANFTNDNEIVRVKCGDIGHGTADEAADIRNTTTGTLPSTGGMGTVAFTVGGIVIMLAALFLLFGGKKKNNN